MGIVTNSIFANIFYTGINLSSFYALVFLLEKYGYIGYKSPTRGEIHYYCFTVGLFISALI